jgi:hypothetical protein
MALAERLSKMPVGVTINKTLMENCQAITNHMEWQEVGRIRALEPHHGTRKAVYKCHWKI